MKMKSRIALSRYGKEKTSISNFDKEFDNFGKKVGRKMVTIVVIYIFLLSLICFGVIKGCQYAHDNGLKITGTDVDRGSDNWR